MKARSFTAKEVVDLLEKRHAEDLFVPECKNGPSQTAAHCRLDAWVMKRSWSNPLTIGYEVKVSRSDFIRDDKWPGYLPLCNQLYFVAPKGVIEAGELSDDVGLLEVASTGNLLIAKKKAKHREVVIPESLFRYILMCRTTISRETGLGTQRERNITQWTAFLEEKAETKKLGWNVARAIREHVERVDTDNRHLKEKMSAYDDVRAILAELGVTDNAHSLIWNARQRIKSLQEVVPPDFSRALQALLKDGERLQSALSEIADQKGAAA